MQNVQLLYQTPGWWPVVLHVLGLPCLHSELRAHPVARALLTDFDLPLYHAEDSLASTGEENKHSDRLQEKHTLHCERELWTSTSVFHGKFLQEDRDPASAFSFFSSAANTWLSKMDWNSCTSIGLVFILTFLSILKIGGFWNNHRRKNFPPGPRALPIIGNLHLFDLKRPYRTYQQVVIIFSIGPRIAHITKPRGPRCQRVSPIAPDMLHPQMILSKGQETVIGAENFECSEICSLQWYFLCATSCVYISALYNPQINDKCSPYFCGNLKKKSS